MTGGPLMTPAPRDSQGWQRTYASRLAFTDMLVLVWVVFGVQIAWFGFDSRKVSFREGQLADLAVNYTAISVLLIVLWMFVLSVYGTRGHRVLGTGPDEYKLIANGALRLFGLVAIAAFFFHIDLARGYILIAFPFGTIVLCASRWIWRQWLNVQRREGRYASRVLLVGSEASAREVALELARRPAAGYMVLGVCLPEMTASGYLPQTEVPVVGTLGDIHDALRVLEVDTVIVTSSDHISPQRLRQLGWSLEAERIRLVVAPSLMDVGGPRVHTRPVAGMPLIHVETPRYEGSKLFTKRTFDLVVSGTLLVVLSPLLVVLAIAVKSTSHGPVLYGQQRVGLRGHVFTMLKFRSMRVGADDELLDLLEAQGTHERPLFKVRNDPRLTSIGAFLRKYSLDELPQLLNVLKGDMSLVGPRPQRDMEVALYDGAAQRRLLLKPGVSGLWQVSGRSALAWEDAIRIDLYYVENWSLAGDVIILWRTVRAVFAPGSEAY